MGYVYKWVNNLNKKWYIGSHDGSNLDYTASGILINHAFNKYGIKNFTKYIIHEGEDYRLVEELSLQSQDAANDPMSYNLKNAAIGGKTSATWDKDNPPNIKDISARNKKVADNRWKNNSPKEWECEYCGTKGRLKTNYDRWHGSECKQLNK